MTDRTPTPGGMICTADIGRQWAGAAPCNQCQTLEKGSARAMTTKERLTVHREIERENERKQKEWRERNEKKSA